MNLLETERYINFNIIIIIIIQITQILSPSDIHSPTHCKHIMLDTVWIGYNLYVYKVEKEYSL